MKPVNISQKLGLIQQYWTPKIVGKLNGQAIKLAKIHGEFMWHKHEKEDECFFVLKGRLEIKFRDRSVFLKAGEFLIVPKGVEHLPIAEEEVHIMLFEPLSTINTGDQVNERTILKPREE